MKKKIYKSLLAAALIAAPAYFISCGTGGTETSNSNQVNTASLTLKAPFKSGVKSQFISQDVSCIEYYVFKHNSNGDLIFNYSGTLTPDNPVVNITNLPTGTVYIDLRMTNGQPVTDSYNNYVYCDGTTLDYLYPYVELAEGQNTFTATMIGNAQWEFVDSNGNPTSITLNKTNPDSTEALSAFDTFTWDTFPGSTTVSSVNKTSIDTTKPSGGEGYHLIWKGTNLDTTLNNCADNTACEGYGGYMVQFIGPNISNNAFETDSINLTPYVDSSGNTWSRMAFIYGAPPGYLEGKGYYGYYQSYYGYYYSYNFSATQDDGTDVISDIESRFNYTTVTSADTMQGTILEIATPDLTRTYTCAWDPGFTNTFDCPSQITSQMLKTSVSKKFKELSTGISSQAIGSDGCYRNVSINEDEISEERTGWYAWNNCQDLDTNGDGTIDIYYACDYNLDGVVDLNDDTNNDGTIDYNDSMPFYIHSTMTATMDICAHQFTAKAKEIPSTDLQINIQ